MKFLLIVLFTTLVFGTNLTYRSPELLKRPWFHEVDVSKYIAYFIASINHDVSRNIFHYTKYNACHY